MTRVHDFFVGGPYLMGIVNVTPDSFSDGGCFLDPQAAIDHGRSLIRQGADILDIGGESTRPGATPVDPAEEMRRVIPVIEALAGGVRWLSADTRHAATMRAALKAGANFINDVSALSFDPKSLDVVSGCDVPVCLMHMRGTPQNMGQQTKYNNMMDDILDYFDERIKACERAGVDRGRLILDPGIGFAKTTAQNLYLIRHLDRVRALGFPVLLGASRKRFIADVSGPCDAGDRIGGSIASALYGIQRGANILRVHDVAATRQALAVYKALNEAQNPQ